MLWQATLRERLQLFNRRVGWPWIGYFLVMYWLACYGSTVFHMNWLPITTVANLPLILIKNVCRLHSSTFLKSNLNLILNVTLPLFIINPQLILTHYFGESQIILAIISVSQTALKLFNSITVQFFNKHVKQNGSLTTLDLLQEIVNIMF